MLVLRAYIALREKYVEQNPTLSYDLNGPLFINQKMEKFKSTKRTLDTSLISELGNVAHLKPYDFRRMWATYVGSSKNLLLRQLGALAASHR